MSRGTTLEPVADLIAAQETLRPILDRVLIEPLDWEPSETLEVVRFGRPLRGIVRAVGPGANPKRYQRNAEGQKASFTYSRHFQRTELKPGQTVELGGLNIYDGAGYQFQQILLNGKKHLICQEADVAIVCGETTD